MSITLAVWLFLFVLFACLAFVRPAWGCALYMLTFFACPGLWWWGKDSIGPYRWAIYAGCIFLAAVVLAASARKQSTDSQLVRRIKWIAAAILVNATLVHAGLAYNWGISIGPYSELAKFILLFAMIVASVRDEIDFRIVLMSMVIGAAYIGYEVTVNDRGKLRGNRLEGVSVPSASSANGLACLMVTILPLTGAFFIAGKRWERLIVLPAAPFIVNVLLLCNSRGAFLAAMSGGVMFIAAAPPRFRRQSLKVACLGCVVVWMLLGDPRIVERFMTTFVEAEERDHSAASRLTYWTAGLRMIADHPLGAGGDGFHSDLGPRYLKQVGVEIEYEQRSVHNGFINEACDWGLQGIALRLAFLGSALVLLRRSGVHAMQCGDHFATMSACGLIAGITGFMAQSVFGDFLDNEWGYWVAACAVGHATVYARHRLGSAGQPQLYVLVPPTAPVDPGAVHPAATASLQTGQ